MHEVPQLVGSPAPGVMRAGELLFTPAKSPHAVVNLELSISITHNFVDLANILAVYDSLTGPAAAKICYSMHPLRSVIGFVANTVRGAIFMWPTQKDAAFRRPEPQRQPHAILGVDQPGAAPRSLHPTGPAKSGQVLPATAPPKAQPVYTIPADASRPRPKLWPHCCSPF